MKRAQISEEASLAWVVAGLAMLFAMTWYSFGWVAFAWVLSVYVLVNGMCHLRDHNRG